MSFWNNVGKVLETVGKAMDPNTHYRNGYQSGLSGEPRYQFMIHDRSAAPMAVNCERAYNQGYDDGTRQRMLNSLRS